MPRPELQAPPEIFYNESEARKYTTSSRIIQIQVSLSDKNLYFSAFMQDSPEFLIVFTVLFSLLQAKISERALELLNFPNDRVPRLLLDIGECF